jgi:LmbE family N-acetylglucosaminyl deacetylase
MTGTHRFTILFSFAHPDDESFAGSGMAMKYAEAGARTVLVTATRGQRGSTGNPPVCTVDELGECRERELREAARIIGFDELHLLDYQDQKLAEAPHDEIRRSVVALIRRLRPVLVVTFDPNGVNAHPDHIAISRFTMDAIVAAADPRWHRDTGAAHAVSRVLWTPPLPPWEAVKRERLEEEPGVDFVLDVARWRERRAAALRAHRTQNQSTERCFFRQPDRDRILSIETWRQAWGPPLARRPAHDVMEGLPTDVPWAQEQTQAGTHQ